MVKKHKKTVRPDPSTSSGEGFLPNGNHNFLLPLYAILAVLVILLDQFTKYMVVSHLKTPYIINKYLSIDLLINRGVSWGMLGFNNTYLFGVVSAVVLVVIVVLIAHMKDQVHNGMPIVGEVLVLAGGISNFIDRVLHQGVVDFVLFSYHGWSWPMFNLADCVILLGIGIMGITVWNRHRWI